MTTRDFHLPGRSPVFAREAWRRPRIRSRASRRSSAARRRHRGRCRRRGRRGAVRRRAGDDRHRRRLLLLVAKPGEPVWGYNGSGRAAARRRPRKFSRGVTHSRGDLVARRHGAGRDRAWEAILKAHGRFGLDRALQPAIRYAENGFPVAPRVAYDWAIRRQAQAHAGAAKHYLPDGKAPAIGSVMRLPALAATLKAIAAGGAKAFYEGEIADDIAATVHRRAGCSPPTISRAIAATTSTPIPTNYRGLDVVELPPNGQGLTALVLLNILERFDLASSIRRAPSACTSRSKPRGSPSACATRTSPTRRTCASRSQACSTRASPKARRAIDPGKRVPLPKAPTPGSDTIYLTVVDRDRTAVSLINSLYGAFGAGICTEKTGIMLHNRGAGFVVEPGHPNRSGRQAADAHHHSGAGDARRPLRDAVRRDGRGLPADGPRAFDHQHGRLRHGRAGRDRSPAHVLRRRKTEVERGVPARPSTGWARGHNVVMRQAPLGGGQAIVIDWERGVLIGGSDPRKDGCALGY